MKKLQNHNQMWKDIKVTKVMLFFLIPTRKRIEMLLFKGQKREMLHASTFSLFTATLFKGKNKKRCMWKEKIRMPIKFLDKQTLSSLFSYSHRPQSSIRLYQIAFFFKRRIVVREPTRVAQLVRTNIRKCGPNKGHIVLGLNPATNDTLNLPDASCCGAINTPRLGSSWKVLKAWPQKVH